MGVNFFLTGALLQPYDPEKFCIGVMEYWSTGVLGFFLIPITPSLQHSDIHWRINATDH
jgi:hypothetical protein